ncbi:MAG: hypothetical protein WAT39_19475, partial [Planctomycetota bacterium]
MLTVVACLTLVTPALLVIPLDGRPVRFGVCLPAAAVASGLRLEGRGQLQWRRLPVGGTDADPVWVELAITGPRGTVRLCAGSGAPCANGSGPVVVREIEEQVLAEGRQRTVRWRWHDGTVDECTRVVFTQPTVVAGESYAAGEARTTLTVGMRERSEVLCRLHRDVLAFAGVMPEPGGGGATTRDLRAHLRTVLPLLHELPGARGAGDYGRSGGVVTNLEFDTTLALLRCAFGLREPAALARALRSATHLLDRDFDPATGLLFPHGPDHRTGTPEPGHVWLQGLLFAALLTADDDGLLAVHNLARALATTPPMGEGASERLRDWAWPLLELEAALVVMPDRVVARAADR